MGDSDGTYLITGGAGFIGSRLAARLMAAGARRVVAFDNLLEQVHAGNPENRARLDAAGAELIVGDVREPGELHEAMARTGPDVVYHLAAETGTGQSFDEPTRYNAVNVMGTAHLIEAIRATGGTRRIVLASSRSIYGEGACVDAEGAPAPAVERRDADMSAGDFAPKDRHGADLTPVPTDASCVPAPASIYASTKLMQEYLLAQAFWGTDVSVGILRLQNVYGEGQSINNPYTGVLSIFARQILEGKQLQIFEDGEITRDFVHVDDVAAAFQRMGTIAAVPAGPVDIGSGTPTTILSIARDLQAHLGAGDRELRVTGAFRPGDIRYAAADISQADATLGWSPAITLDRGVAELAEWSRRMFDLDRSSAS